MIKKQELLQNDIDDEIRRLRLKIESLEAENEDLKLTKEELIEQRAYLIENNCFEERCSEATHYTWLDDENDRLEQDNLNLKQQILRLKDFVGEII